MTSNNTSTEPGPKIAKVGHVTHSNPFDLVTTLRDQSAFQI